MRRGSNGLALFTIHATTITAYDSVRCSCERVITLELDAKDHGSYVRAGHLLHSYHRLPANLVRTSTRVDSGSSTHLRATVVDSCIRESTANERVTTMAPTHFQLCHSLRLGAIDEMALTSLRRLASTILETIKAATLKMVHQRMRIWLPLEKAWLADLLVVRGRRCYPDNMEVIMKEGGRVIHGTYKRCQSLLEPMQSAAGVFETRQGAPASICRD